MLDQPVLQAVGQGEPACLDDVSGRADGAVGLQGRRPPGSDIDSADAEQYDGGDALRDSGSPERLMFRDEVKEMIFKTIDELPEDLRTAIMLREIDGLSYEEIAESMDCPVGTVRSRIFRARDAIDQKIAPLLEQGWRS